MPKTILTPILIEGSPNIIQLRFSDTSTKQLAVNQRLGNEEMGKLLSCVISPGPIVKIGHPQWWHLTPMLKHCIRSSKTNTNADLLENIYKDAELYLVQVSCAFQSDIERPIEYARLTTYLRPQSGQKNPVALDIYPRQVLSPDKINTQTEVKITSCLTFTDNECNNIPDDWINIVYNTLPPIINGNITGESAPYWEFLKFNSQQLFDSRFGYLIIKKPRIAKAVRIIIDISTQVRTPFGLLIAESKEKDKPILTQTICTEWINIL